MSPDGHERVTIVPLEGGPVRDVAVGFRAFGLSFAPDGRSLVATDRDNGFRVIRR